MNRNSRCFRSVQMQGIWDWKRRSVPEAVHWAKPKCTWLSLNIESNAAVGRL